MRLPADNSVLLAKDNTRLAVDRADRPFPNAAALEAFLPAWVRRLRAPLRDALTRQLGTVGAYIWAQLGQYLGALQTPRNAGGLALDGHGERRRRPRAAGEADPPYRARLLSRPSIITPTAIRDAVTALVRSETPVGPVLFEPAVDGPFVSTPGAAWHAFVQAPDQRLWGEYPDNRNPRAGAAYVIPVGQHALPVFWAVLEGELVDDPGTPYALAVGNVLPGGDGLYLASDFVGNAAPLVAWGYFALAAGPLVDRVIREVEARRGGGVVWTLLVDPLIGAAL